ncbi:MAG: hypothetical protein NXI00_11010 [Cytophagales bacterium]|nr:hypothetical protein [Cytophagales bacterium]
MRKILVFYILMIAASLSFAQNAKIKKLVTDDNNALFKADTSIILVNDSAFQKIVSVHYKFISQEILKEEYERKKMELDQQLESDRRAREELNERINKSKSELEAYKSFYQTARKELKFEIKNIDDPDPDQEKIKAKAEARIQQIEIRDNPRKVKQ